MSFLKRLLGRGTRASKLDRGVPVPDLPIHPDDQDLVTEADRAWLCSLTLESFLAIKEQDMAAKMALIMHLEDEGVTEEQAVHSMNKALPSYYGKLEHRNTPYGVSGDDVGLPFVIKDRVNRAVEAGKIGKQDIQGASSLNALVRRLIRSGLI